MKIHPGNALFSPAVARRSSRIGWLGVFLVMGAGIPAYSQDQPQPGYSGMAQIHEGKYVVVHDAKTDEEGPRVGIIQIRKNRLPEYSMLEIPDWKHGDGRSNDLESICALPGRSKEFLMAESGYRDNRFGRIFHIRVQKKYVRVWSVLALPHVGGKPGGDRDDNDDNYEGLACIDHRGDKVLVVLGERGGSRQHASGVLRWGWYDLSARSLTWPIEGRKGKEIQAPGTWVHPGTKRDIGDLYFDVSGILWGVATEDAGDDGPFRSVVYRLAKLQADSEDPLQLIHDGKPMWMIEGLKIEALSGPAGIPGSGPLSIGSEDENYGGVWRPLYPALANP